ncbi:hypothetical protein [Chryseobacterium lacus]|uniref:hypothetical protein n=1 Tax=Chryseobacterium lacus TaxID=2058346 RepID=UPI001E35F530|nr:hypothetical protein [Chryseobacterium lacus]
MPYSYLHLPTIPKVKKLPVILSREEIWRMLQTAELLKHKLLIGLIYGWTPVYGSAEYRASASGF